MTKNEFLLNIKQYNDRLLAIETQKEMLCRLRTKLYYPKVADYRQSRVKKAVGDYEDWIIEIINTEDEITRKLEINKFMRDYIDKALNALPKEEREIIRLLYIECLPAQKVCNILHYSRRTLYRNIDKAFNRLKLYGKV